MLTLLLFVLVLTAVVLPHEIGHYIFALRAGIRPLELGLGFGPKLFSFKKGKTVYSINAFPLGGFIRIAGLSPDEEKNDPPYPPEESYMNKSPIKKALTILGGPLMNFVFAFLLLSFIFMAFGAPTGISNEVASVIKGSAAERAGFMAGDRIISINGIKVDKMEAAIDIIHKSSGKELGIILGRGDRRFAVLATPEYDKKLKAGLLGFGPKVIFTRYGPISALVLGAKQTLTTALVILSFLWLLISGGAALSDLAGPVGIAQFTGQAAQGGIASFLGFAAFLSINLGIVNLLPLPALDGGRALFIALEAIRKKPLPLEVENRIHYVGFALLMALAALLTVNDIMRWVSVR
jgi:regulator of sigma E protease